MESTRVSEWIAAEDNVLIGREAGDSSHWGASSSSPRSDFRPLQ